METTIAPKPKQPIHVRVAFFVVGGAMSVALNKSILNFLQNKIGWPQSEAFAASVVTTAIVFFLWSYYINFRTSTAWKNCLPRYLAVLLFCNFLNYLIGLSGFKEFGSGGWKGVVVIAAVYSFTGCVKFVLYNFWVFPSGGAGAPPSAS
jgi:hypothetical protein